MVSHEDERAFPVTMEDGRGESMTNLGMTLRDYFAAKAMTAALSACSGREFADNFRERCHQHGHSITEALAMDAYRLADAMLAERAK